MPKTGYSMRIGTKGKGGRQDHSVKSIARLRQIANHNKNKHRNDTETVIGSGNALQDVRAVYEKYLPHAKDEYNAHQLSQGKRGRMITDTFFDFMSRNGKSNMAVEAIIGAGDKDFWIENDLFGYMTDDEAREALTMMLGIMQDTFPGLKIASAIIHNRDQGEASWHMHVVGVPIAAVEEIPGNKVKVIERDRTGKPIRDRKGNYIYVYDIGKDGKPHNRYETNPDGSFKLAKKTHRGCRCA